MVPQFAANSIDSFTMLVDSFIKAHAGAIKVAIRKSDLFKVKRILIDPGNSANIIRLRVVEKLGLQDQIVPAARILNGFNMASETTRGEVILPVNVATIQETKFYVIEGDMRYNALLGRPWIHNMRTVPSTLHQMLKFPTPNGVKMVHREQNAAKEMFIVDEVIPVSALSSTKGSESKGKQEAK
ncbi:uncharacterized protein [Nicotiana tomentosiformis]|uniref:uncharacterized protein n=1 Tax=Nicotiana tomentosiformis TaxID=4098 RepID=UPI00388C91B9